MRVFDRDRNKSESCSGHADGDPGGLSGNWMLVGNRDDVKQARFLVLLLANCFLCRSGHVLNITSCTVYFKDTAIHTAI